MHLEHVVLLSMEEWYPPLSQKNSDLDLCAKSIARGGFYHAGQVCVSVQRIYLSKNVSDSFIDKFKEEVKKVNLGDPMDKKTVVGPLIRNSEIKRVDQWVSESLKNGSKLILEVRFYQNVLMTKQ